MLANIIVFALLAVVVFFAIKGTVRKFTKGGGCCGEHEGPAKKVVVKDRAKSHYPYQVTLQVGGMSCENCAKKVENALNQLEGTWATVSISSHSASVLSKTLPQEETIREAVRQAGYVVTSYQLQEQ